MSTCSTSDKSNLLNLSIDWPSQSVKRVSFAFISLFILIFTAGHYLKNSLMQGRYGRIQFYYDGGSDWQSLFGDASASLNLLKIFVFIVLSLVLYGVSYFRFKKMQLKT